MADVHEIADGIFRIATFIPEANITFNQFLIADEKPLVFHAGQRLLFPLTLEAVRQVIDPSRRGTFPGRTWKRTSPERSMSFSRSLRMPNPSIANWVSWSMSTTTRSVRPR